MKPVVLPMLHLLYWFQDRDWLPRSVCLLASQNSQHAFELMREYLDKPRHCLLPVVEDPLGAAAAGQVHVSCHEVADELHVLLIEQRLKIDRLKIAAFFGEFSVLVEDISHSTAHAGRKIPAARTKHHNQSIRHVLAPVVADSFDHGGRPGIANSEAFSGNSIEERFAARGAVKCDVSDDDVFFGSEPRTARRIYHQPSARKPLSDVVVSLAFQRERDALRQKRP